MRFVIASLSFAWLLIAVAHTKGAQQPLPQAANQSAVIREVSGTIASVEETCTSFTLVPDNSGRKGEEHFTRIPDRVSWSHESDMCSFTSIGGKQLMLRPGAYVSFRYLNQGGRKLIQWVVMFHGPHSLKCEGQGGAEPAPNTLYQLDCEGIPTPVCVRCPNPNYDDASRRERLEGNVLLKVLVLPDGRVSSVQIVQGFTQVLDQSSADTVRKWRFKPLVGPGGAPIAAIINVEVTFRLI